MRIEVVDDPVRTGARHLADAIGRTLDERGRCSLALSRGSELCRDLAALRADWGEIDVFQVDERAAPDGASERNLTSIERDLVGNVTGSAPVIHPMPVTGDLEAGAHAYEHELERVCGSPPVLDVVHLGMGADGHIASLVPGDPVLDVTDRWVAVTGLYERYRRMTLTFPVLSAARTVVLIASGEAKARAVAALRAADRSIPAGRLTSDMTVLVDPSAASEG